MDSSPPSTPNSCGTSTPPAFSDIVNGSGSPPLENSVASTSGRDELGDNDEPKSHLSCTLQEIAKDGAHSPKETLAKLLKGKEREWTAVAKKGPLRLLDLPVDILKEIIHQLPHTNDLTSLALCHSALHRLTIPCIYSRFDIVWPDETTHTEPRSGVDALTYGLATLVMAEDSFPHQSRQRQSNFQSSKRTALGTISQNTYPIARRRFGNYYAQFTKKFSLGNGPAAWVQEYMIAKEGGKMLGTLVALAVARMINLETFVWDMPTGVLRDVWLALSSLADRTDGEDCRLERLWVRWHDNTQLDAPTPAPPPPMILNNVPPPPNTAHPSGAGTAQAPVVVPVPYTSPSISAIDRVEHPSFSVIPPLKSLSVLDIDELPYLDEMAILIARSQKKLRELRVGIARHAQQRDWVTAWEGDGIQQVDYSTTWTTASSISEKRLGGVLGILVGRVFNMRQNEDSPTKSNQMHDASERSATNQNALKTNNANTMPATVSTTNDRDIETDSEQHVSSIQEGVSLMNNSAMPLGTEQSVSSMNATSDSLMNGDGLPIDSIPAVHINPTLNLSKKLPVRAKRGNGTSQDLGPHLNGKLRLETLELERVPLSVIVLLKAFDWSKLTNLTLLHCQNHEQLWKSLRRTYSPRVPYPNSPKVYEVSLKKLHTNSVSPSLISFLRETLAPNSLEVLFLQEGRSYTSPVSIDAIYRGPLKRHRSSLKKLMIDSSEKGPDGHSTSSRWRRWMVNREIITFVTSGRMTSLRELGVSIDYRDWHYFLQRLPLLPSVRSLYIPFIADHAHGNNIDPRELALQIVDIVHLRPEVEVCYMGISTKCFEILENRPSNYDLRHDSNVHGTDGLTGGPPGGAYMVNDPLMTDDEDETEDEDQEDSDGAVEAIDDDTDVSSEDSIDNSDEDESFLQDDRKGPRLRLREILFYEDRIELFKCRHSRI